MPPAGKVAPEPAAAPKVVSVPNAAKTDGQVRNADAQSQAKSLNKFLNDSGRADEFRVDPTSNNTRVQQINPANGLVVGEFSVQEFPDLARSLGASGLLVDDIA